MTKKDDTSNRDLDETEDDEERDEEETDEESDEEGSDEDEGDETSDDDSDEEEDEDEEDDEDEAAAPARPASSKPAAGAAAKAAADEDDEEDDEEEDDDEDLEDEDEDEDEDEEEDEDAAPAHAVGRDDHGAADRARRRRELADAGHGDHGHGDHDHDDDYDPNDKTWWAPHAVLGTLVLLGVLGFFGVFNKPLAFLAAKPKTEESKPAANEPAKPATPTPPTTARPGAPPTGASPDGAQRETFGAKHLLVMYKGGRRAPPNVTRTKEEAKARADEAHKKAKGGTKFEDLVKEYSDEPGAGQRGGDLGNFPKGAMVPEFQAGLEKTKVGEVSDVVETPFGYHVILRTK